MEQVLLAELQPGRPVNSYDEKLQLQNYPRVEHLFFDQLEEQYIYEFATFREKYQVESLTQHKIATFLILYAKGSWIPVWKDVERVVNSSMGGYAFKMAFEVVMQGSLAGTGPYPQDMYIVDELAAICRRSREDMAEGREKAYWLAIEAIQEHHVEDLTPWMDFLEKTKEGTELHKKRYIQLVKTVMASQVGG